MLMGLEIAAALAKLYPDHFHIEKILPLVGNAAAVARLERRDSRPRASLVKKDPELESFRVIRAK